MPGAGVEPARCRHRGIFVPATVFTAVFSANTFGVWTFSLPYPIFTGRRQEPSSLYTFLDAMKLHKYTEEQLREAVESSTSLRQVLLKLKVAPYGGNYTVLQKAIDYYRLNTAHFSGQAWSKGKSLPSKRSLEDYLENRQPIQSYNLKKRLLAEGVFKHQCMKCNRTKWNDQPIPLELDHIDGNNKNNRLENLHLLCPNCHALTPTYRSKNRIRA